MRKARRLPAIIAIVCLGLLPACSKEADRQPEDSAGVPEVAAKTNATSGYGNQNLQPGRTASQAGLPRMIDLGRGKCVPCKLMEPILKELKQQYEGRAVIEVIDLNEREDAVAEYGIRLIPTQIFFDAAGNEVWRHEGFLAKDAIIDKLRQLGVEPVDR